MTEQRISERIRGLADQTGLSIVEKIVSYQEPDNERKQNDPVYRLGETQTIAHPNYSKCIVGIYGDVSPFGDSNSNSYLLARVALWQTEKAQTEPRVEILYKVSSRVQITSALNLIDLLKKEEISFFETPSKEQRAEEAIMSKNTISNIEIIAERA